MKCGVDAKGFGVCECDAYWAAGVDVPLLLCEDSWKLGSICSSKMGMFDGDGTFCGRGDSGVNC